MHAVVSIEHIATFKRMQDLTKDLSEVVAALRTSDELVVDEEGKMVRRKNPLPETSDAAERTIYAVAFSSSTFPVCFFGWFVISPTC